MIAAVRSTAAIEGIIALTSSNKKGHIMNGPSGGHNNVFVVCFFLSFVFLFLFFVDINLYCRFGNFRENNISRIALKYIFATFKIRE